MKIDAYSHILPGRYFARMRELVVDAGALKRWLELPALHDLDARLEMMREFGDEYQQILTLSSPPIELLAGPDESLTLARLANESMKEICDAHPERFPAFVASLPMNNPAGCVAEIGHAIDVLGARGVQIFTNVNGMPLDDPSLAPVFAEIARRDVPVWMHPTRSAASSDYRIEETSKYEIWWAFGWPYETSVAMARLVFSGLFDRHPGLRIVVHHMGAMIPFLEGRIRLGWGDQLGSRSADEDYGALRNQLAKEPIDYFRQFYADTALCGSAIGTRCGLDFFGVDHVVFGTDCPFDAEGGPMYVRETIRVIDALEIPEAERNAIYSGNIRALTGME